MMSRPVTESFRESRPAIAGRGLSLTQGSVV